MKKLPLQSVGYLHLEKAFGQWLDVLGYAPKTVYTLPNAVRSFLYFLEQQNCKQVSEVQTRHLKDYYQHLSSRANHRQGGALSSKYLNQQFWALEKFFEFLHHKGVKGLPVLNLKRLKAESIEREILTQAEIKELYELARTQQAHTQKQEALNHQYLVLLSVYYACGLRRTEGVQVSVDDLNFDTRILHVKKGKNSKQRLIPFNKTTAVILQDWVYQHRALLVKDKTESALFINHYGKPLTGGTLNDKLQTLMSQSENPQIRQKRITLHSLRHSIATHLLQNGMEIQKVQRFLGHTSLDTTEIYTHLIP